MAQKVQKWYWKPLKLWIASHCHPFDTGDARQCLQEQIAVATYWISVVLLDPYILCQQDLNFFWQCWDKGWQLPDVKTAVQVVCYIMPSLANNGKKINCRSTNTSHNLKEINPSPKTAFLFTQNCWRKQHVGLKTHEEHLAVTSADLGIHGECCCVRHIEGLQTQVFWSLLLACGSCPGQRVWMSQLPSRRGQSLPSCALEQLTYSNGAPALSNALQSEIAVPDTAHGEVVC